MATEMVTTWRVESVYRAPKKCHLVVRHCLSNRWLFNQGIAVTTFSTSRFTHFWYRDIKIKTKHDPGSR